MFKAKKPKGSSSGVASNVNESLTSVSCGTKKLLLAALELGGSWLETARFFDQLPSGVDGEREQGTEFSKPAGSRCT
ncbi:hypothetical protein HVA01_33890 [Halovibrio variabilis]|uniref:Uncharacterized protein n=1 Tax=Halovibrio variabilis TaxID=31910 RepID=A0A511UWB2_9GAMM|nr:hypothetical protein HVA01_33890 [Halovibrio variabilis]